MKVIFHILIVYLSSNIVSDVVHGLSEIDRKNCFQYYLKRYYNYDNVNLFNSYNGSSYKECNDTVEAEALKFYNNLTTTIENDEKMNDSKDCIIKFIKGFNVSNIALKDMIYNNSEEIILNNNVRGFLLKFSYFYCTPGNLGTILFEIDYEAHHWNNFSLNHIKKEFCLALDAIAILGVRGRFNLDRCENKFSQKITYRSVAEFFNSLLPDSNKSCLIAKFQEKGLLFYTNQTTEMKNFKNQVQNCDQIYNQIHKIAKISFNDLFYELEFPQGLWMMLVSKLAQCFINDIMDEEFLYKILFYLIQPEYTTKEEKPNAEKEFIQFVTLNMQNYINCLVHVGWKIETILVLYKYIAMFQNSRDTVSSNDIDSNDYDYDYDYD